MGNPLKSQGSTFYVSTEDAAVTDYDDATMIKVGQVSNIGAPSGTAAKIDTTHLESEAKEFFMGLPDNGDVEISGNALDADMGHDELEDAKEAQEKRWFHVIRSDESIRYWRGVVLKFTDFEMGVDAKVPFTATIAIDGAIGKVAAS